MYKWLKWIVQIYKNILQVNLEGLGGWNSGLDGDLCINCGFSFVIVGKWLGPKSVEYDLFWYKIYFQKLLRTSRRHMSQLPRKRFLSKRREFLFNEVVVHIVVCCYGSDSNCPKALIRSDQIEKYVFHLQFYSSLRPDHLLPLSIYNHN